jgi:hypothetical protein
MAEAVERILVVDADGHVNEGDVDISGHLPPKWRSQGPIHLNDKQGYRRMLLERRRDRDRESRGHSPTSAQNAVRERPILSRA